VGDKFAMYFIDERPRVRSFVVSGIYQTSLMEFDKQFIIGDIAHVQSLNNWDSSMVSGIEVLIDDYKNIDRLSDVVFTIE
jgi:lipoprotein-releasing system permease protein